MFQHKVDSAEVSLLFGAVFGGFPCRKAYMVSTQDSLSGFPAVSLIAALRKSVRDNFYRAPGPRPPLRR